MFTEIFTLLQGSEKSLFEDSFLFYKKKNEKEHFFYIFIKKKEFGYFCRI